MLTIYLFIYLISLLGLKEEKVQKNKVRQKKHNRLDTSGRKACRFTGTGTLAMQSVMEMGW